MEIKPGRYRAANGKIVIIEVRQQCPIPMWRGHFEEESSLQAGWQENGQETSGHKSWNLIESLETTTRWNLQCIPTELDEFVRHRQIDEKRKFLCQQVVSDLQAYYAILERQVLTGEENDV